MQSAAGARQESGAPPVRAPRLLRAILLGVAFSVPFHLLLVGVLALIPMLRPVAPEPEFEVFDVVLAAPTPLERPAEPSAAGPTRTGSSFACDSATNRIG